MKNFSIKSTLNTFQWMLLSNRRQLLTLFVCVAIATFVAGELMLMNTVTVYSHARRETLPNMGYGMPYVFLIAYGLWMLYGASRMFGFMRSKQSAITYLMHPAQNAEKFVARWLYTTVLWALIGGLGLLVGDFLRWAANPLFGTKAPMAIVNFWNNTVNYLVVDTCIDNNRDTLLVLSLIAAYCVWAHSLYMLGSAVFRRHRVLFTTIAFVFLHFFAANVQLDSLGDSCLFAITSLVVLTVLDVVASYLIFRRMQVINNRWINI